MGRKFQPARFGGSTVPEHQSMVTTDAQTFKKGAVLIYDAATGRVIEGGADPTPIVGVANEHAESKPGFGVGHASVVVATTGRVTEVTVVKANRSTIFSGRMINGATDPVTPVQADINKLYGIAKVGDDWVVDQADTTNTRVEIVDIDIPTNLVLFRFMEAHLAQP